MKTQYFFIKLKNEKKIFDMKTKHNKRLKNVQIFSKNKIKREEEFVFVSFIYLSTCFKIFLIKKYSS